MINGTYLVKSKTTKAQYILRIGDSEPFFKIENSFDLNGFSKKDGAVKQVSEAILNDIRRNSNHYVFVLIDHSVIENVENIVIHPEDEPITDEQRAKYREIWNSTHSVSELRFRVMMDFKLSTLQAAAFIQKNELCK